MFSVEALVMRANSTTNIIFCIPLTIIENSSHNPTRSLFE